MKSDNEEGEENLGRKSEFDIPPSYEEIKFEPSDCPLTLEDLDPENSELWLIKLPPNLDVKTLKGQTLNMKRPSKLKTDKEVKRLATIPNKSAHLENFSVLLPSSKTKKFAPVGISFTGQLSIVEEIRLPEIKPPSDEMHQALKIPDGLQQRFIPFGSICTSPKMKKHKKKKKIKEEMDYEANMNGISSEIKIKVEKITPKKSKRKKSKLNESEECDEKHHHSKKKRKLDYEDEEVKPTIKEEKNYETEISVNGKMKSPKKKIKKEKDKEKRKKHRHKDYS